MAGNQKLKIVIIGAGSTYTPELIEGLLKRKALLNIGRLTLMDIDEKKLEIVGNLAKRMIAADGVGWDVEFSADYGCIKGADYVLTQIRVGQMRMRVLDEKIPLKYNLIGQETCGIGGFMKAYRTIPVLFAIADEIKKHAPDAYLINFTNPSGLVAQALNAKEIKSVGLCNCPFAMRRSVLSALCLADAQIDYVGLNHFAWITAIRHNGKDYLEEAIKSGIHSEAMKNIPANGFSAELLQTVGGIPSTYMEYYYYPQKKLETLLKEPLSRGEVCQKLEETLLKQYQEPSLNVKPKELEARGGAFYSEVAVGVLEAIENDTKSAQVVNVKNRGALPFLEDDDVIEISSVISKDRITPIGIDGFSNEHIIASVKMMKDYERMAVRAILSKNEDDAICALMHNPLGKDYHAVRACFRELRELNRAYIDGEALH
ncbi:MAG: 6-phospho-beta-glucosidase [Clostridiales bacterium]|jgi:6-phospho-beta-glucosidase|nr:6-phospho-beta-glucosidase [Clostridiales bacterium]